MLTNRRIFEDAHALRGAPARRGRGYICGPVDLKRLGIIDAVEVATGPQLIAYAIDLPAFHFGFKILAKRFASRLISPSRRRRHWRLQSAPSVSAMPGIACSVAVSADIIGAFLRQSPQFGGRLPGRPARSGRGRNAQSPASHRAEMMTGRVPADMPALEHCDARHPAARPPAPR